MPLPRKPYAEWEAEDLAQLVANPRAQEGDRLDFKKDCSLLRTEPNAQERARRDLLVDVASMANGVGGALLFGVDENPMPDSPPVANKLTGIPTSKVKPLSSAITDLVDTHLEVRPMALRPKPVEIPGSDDRSVLIVEVPANTYSLSMVTYNGLNQFWVRRGWSNKPMTTTEIQYAMERLINVRDNADKALDRLVSSLGEVPPGCAWFACVPLDRARNCVPARKDALKPVQEDTKTQLQAFGAHSVKYPLLGALSVGRCRPSLGGMSYENPERNWIVSIGREGSVLLAIAQFNSAVDIYPREIYRTWAGGYCIFRSLQKHFGVSGSAVAQVGLCNCGGLELGDGKIGKGNIIPFDKVTIDDTTDRKTVFTTWATQLMNLVHEEEPVSLPGWVGE